MKPLAIFCAAGVIAGGIFVSAQPPPRLPSEPRRQFGSSITGAFEGWYYNQDGSRTFLVGYLNRNFSQEVDVPIGPNNRIEPGGPDMGQPTHFLTGRRHGMFIMPVPRNFGEKDSLTWTLVVNNQSTSIPLRLTPDYVVDPFKEIAVNNTPPVLRFEPNGSPFQGPIASPATAVAREAKVGTPLPLTLWAADDEKYTSGTSAPLTTPRPPVTLLWSKYRGPGAVTFDNVRPAVDRVAGGNAAFSGKSTVTATFAEAGDYVLHVLANDYSGEGGGGFVCCWSTAMVKVAVKP